MWFFMDWQLQIMMCMFVVLKPKLIVFNTQETKDGFLHADVFIYSNIRSLAKVIIENLSGLPVQRLS